MKPLPAVLFLVLTLLPGGTVRTADADPVGAGPWSLADVAALQDASDAHFSPDGRWVVFVVSAPDIERDRFDTDLWRVPAAGGEARRLTYQAGADEHPRFSPDGAWIAFLSSRPDPTLKIEGEEGERPGAPRRQIWILPVDGGEARRLTAAPEGVSGFEWSPDGTRMAYRARDPKSEERRKAEKEKNDAVVVDQDLRTDHLWVISVSGGEAKRLTQGSLHVLSQSWSPDGKWVAFGHAPGPKVPDQFAADVSKVPAAGGDVKSLVSRPGPDGGEVAWSPDGKTVAFTSQEGKADWYVNGYLCTVPADGGRITNLTSSFDEEAEHPRWTPDSRALLFSAARGTSVSIWQVPAGGGAARRLTPDRGVVGPFDLSRDGSLITATWQDDVHSVDVHLWPARGGEGRRLSRVNAAADARTVFAKERISWKGKGGLGIEGLLVKPAASKDGKPVPLLLVVHGGPAGIHQETFTARRGAYPFQLFAQAGYAVLLPNPRGSGGRGESFRAANVRDWGGADYEDLMAGVDQLVRIGIADPDRLGVMGWSYGGFMTSMILSKTNRFRAASVGAGVTDAVSMLAQTDIPEFMRSYFGAWPWEDADVYDRSSAVRHIGACRTPTLIQHGEADDRVPPPQGWELYVALKRLGTPVEFVLYPRTPHGPREPELFADVMRRNLDWFTRWIPVTAPGSTPAASSR